MKKAQGISLNVIVIAAIALLVLVILTFIFAGGMADWTKKSKDCNRDKLAECQSGDECDDGWIPHPSRICYDGNEVDDGQVCCLPESS